MLIDKIQPKIRPTILGFGDGIALSSLPRGLVSLIVARNGGIDKLKGPGIEYDYTDYTYANGEVALGDPDGAELWDGDIVTQYVDENNYSTYDAATGIGRIVSDGAYVALRVVNAMNIGSFYTFKYEEISRSSGYLTTNDAPQHVFVDGSEETDLETNTNINLDIKRYSGPTDVTFKLSVQALEVIPAVDDGKGVYVGPGYTNELPEGAEDYNDTDWSGAVYYSATEETTIGGIKAYKLETLAGLNLWDRYGVPALNLEAGKTYTVSYLVKKGNINSIAFRGTAESTKGWLAFDLDSGEVGNMYDGTELLYSNPTIIPYADGYQIGYTIEVLVTGDHKSVSAITYNTATIGDYQYVSSPMVVESSYQFPYIPPGATQPECGATSGGNGIALELSGERADGVERYSHLSSFGDNITEDGGTYTCTTPDVTNDNRITFVSDGTITDTKASFSFTVVNQGAFYVHDGSSFVNVGVLGIGRHSFTVTTIGNSFYVKIVSSGGALQDPSIQKLEPYISPLKQCFQGEPEEAVELCQFPIEQRIGYEYSEFETTPSGFTGEADGVTFSIAGVDCTGQGLLTGDKVWISFIAEKTGYASNPVLQERPLTIGGTPNAVLSPVDSGVHGFSHTLTVDDPFFTFTYEPTRTGTISISNLSIKKVVELWDDDATFLNAGWTDNLDGTFTFVHGSGDATISVGLVLSGYDRSLRDYTIVSNSFDGTLRCPDEDPVIDIPSTVGRHLEVITQGEFDEGISFRCVGGSSGSLTIRVNSIQKLNPATMTMAALVTMGVGLSEIPGTYSLAVATCNNVNKGVLQYQGTASWMVKANDGTTVTRVTGTWERGERHLKIVETDEAGTQFRVGNYRLNIDTAIQWSSWTTFDGSFNPVDYLRLGYIITVPLHIKFLATFDYGEVPEATLLKLLERYK